MKTFSTVLLPRLIPAVFVAKRCMRWARQLAVLATLVTLITSVPAFAQIRDVAFDITPSTAGPGVTRQISVTLMWPSFCERNGATIVGTYQRKNTVTIRLEGHVDATTFYFCDTISPYTTAVSFTPAAEGDLRVVLVTNDGQYLGETTLNTRAAGSNRSTVDLSGMWYDPATLGSGLTFVHSFAKSDQVFGTWYVYDDNGVARWYSIQNVIWSAGGTVAEGQIYETRADSVVCVPPFAGCPITFASIVSPARARIVVKGPNTAQIQAITASGSVLFSSNIVRSIF